MTKNSDELRLLSKSAAATKLGVGKVTLGKLIESGKIKVTCLNNKIKISTRELNRFVEESTVPQSELNQLTQSNSIFRLRQTQPTPNSHLQKALCSNADKLFYKLKTEVNNGFGLSKKE